MNRDRRRASTCCTLGLAGAALLVSTGCDGPGRSAGADAVKSVPAIAVPAIAVAAGSCASGWQPQPAGIEHYLVQNRSRAAMRITFVGAARGEIYGQLWQLEPGTSQPLTMTVPAGTYRWRCLPADGSGLVSAIQPVRGPGGRGARALRPLTADEILAAVAVYRQGVGAGLAVLDRDTAALRTAVASGDRTAARRHWLTAHLDYERLGAAYGTFGDYDGAINGRPDDLPGGTADPGFTGFLRLEHGLWHGETMQALRPVAGRLGTDVHALRTAFPKLATPPADLPLRAHEIGENTLQFELTADTDQGAHSNLATASANLAGTRLVLAALRPALLLRDPGLLGTATTDVARVQALLTSHRDRVGRWAPVQSLDRGAWEHLNAAFGRLLEDLAGIPGVLQMPPSTAPS
jgi:high-affinity iron transporter